jgi:hypothetical protein
MREQAVTNSALSRALGGVDRVSTPRIRAWREEKWKAPRAATCFRVGQALRTCGVAWASGAVALFTARHLAEFVYALADLDRRGLAADAIITALLIEEALEGTGDARDVLDALERPHGYAKLGSRASAETAAFRVAALIATAYHDLDFDYLANRVISEVTQRGFHDPTLWVDRRVLAARTMWMARQFRKRGDVEWAAMVLRDGRGLSRKTPTKHQKRKVSKK